MGSQASTLERLDKTFEWYIFLVGDYRIHSWLNDFFNDNFTVLADRIGRDAVIVQKLNSQLTDELKAAFSNDKKPRGLSDSLERQYPGLLIVNKHPAKLKDRELKRGNDKVIYIPFSALERAYTQKETNTLLANIADFVRYDDKALRRKTSGFSGLMHRLQANASVSDPLGIISFGFSR